MQLRSLGLGHSWMTADVPAEMPGYMLPYEFDGLVLSMYPAVIQTGYEMCWPLWGANHTAVIPLPLRSGSRSPTGVQTI